MQALYDCKASEIYDKSVFSVFLLNVSHDFLSQSRSLLGHYVLQNKLVNLYRQSIKTSDIRMRELAV